VCVHASQLCDHKIEYCVFPNTEDTHSKVSFDKKAKTKGKMRISAAPRNKGKLTGGTYLRTSLSLMIAVALVLSGNAENASQVRKRVLGIGFSPESSTSFSSDDIDTVMEIEPEPTDSEDDTSAPIISDGMVVDEATLSPIVTKKAEKSSKKDKETKAPTTKSSATKKPKEPTKKSAVANKLKVSTASKLPKEASKVNGKQRKLGIGFVPPTPDSSDDDNEDISMISEGMVEDGATTESVEAEAISKKSKAPTEYKSSKTSKKKATKSPTSESLDYGAVDFGSTEEPTSSTTFISSSFTFGPTGTFEPTSFPTGSPTRTPTGIPTGTPTEAPTEAPIEPIVIPKSPKKTKAPEASKKSKSPTTPKKK